MEFLAIYSSDKLWQFNISDNGFKAFGLALLISIIAILTVFAILFIIVLSVNVLKLVGKGKEEVATISTPTVNKKLTLSDIKDEDMMVAALIATIDYNNETKKDARLVSIKEIK